jgi:hypothetical protein
MLFFNDLFQSPFCCLPIDILEEGLNIICPLQPIINHKGMLKDIQYQDRYTAARMSYIMFIYPEVDESSGGRVLV